MAVEKWMKEVKAGHYLRPDPLWNNWERSYRHLAVPSEILDVAENIGSEVRIIFKVRFRGGDTSWLSAAWFCKPNSKYPLCKPKKHPLK